jgi:hypothetical protein
MSSTLSHPWSLILGWLISDPTLGWLYSKEVSNKKLQYHPSPTTKNGEVSE